MVEGTTERECPYCKESISARAVICHYCASGITPAMPSHGGTCPFCGEAIRETALKCQHCKSMVEPMPAQAGLRFAVGSSTANCKALCFLHYPFDPAKQQACDAGCDFNPHPHVVEPQLIVR